MKKRILARYAKVFGAMAVLWALGLATGVYIIANQNGEFPKWLPILGDDPYVVHAEITTAQGVIPGQGQLVEVAGVVVGRVSSAKLVDGRAILEIHLERGKVKLFHDATILLRPRTLLKDMILSVTPGHPSAGMLREGDTVPIANTLPDVNLDELLSALDGDTRDALIALAQGAGEGIGGQQDQLTAFFRQLDPTLRRIRRINDALLGRRHELARAVTSFSRISQTLAQHRTELTRFVGSSSAVFGALAAEQTSVRASLRELPATLTHVETSMAKLHPVATRLGSVSRDLLPGARALGGGARALAGMFDTTTGALRDDLRPFARTARAPLGDLRRATHTFSAASGAAQRGTTQLNGFFSDLARAPKQGAASYLFWAAWATHQLNSVLSSQDALGPYAHTLFLTNCESLRLLPGFIQGDPPLALHVSLANLPRKEQVCP